MWTEVCNFFVTFRYCIASSSITVGASLRCGCSYTRHSFAMIFRLLIFMCTLNNLIYRPFLRSDIRVIDAMMVCSTCLSGIPSFHFYWPAIFYGCSIFVACWTCVCILFFFSRQAIMEWRPWNNTSLSWQNLTTTLPGIFQMPVLLHLSLESRDR